jgi:hypothetical protein
MNIIKQVITEEDHPVLALHAAALLIMVLEEIQEEEIQVDRAALAVEEAAAVNFK